MAKKVIEMVINENDLTDEVFAISVVNKPAIQENFIALSEHEIELKTIDEEKRLLLGAVLVPDKQILRLDKNGEPFYIKFPTATIRKASEIFLSRGYQNNSTLEHKIELDGMSVVESWIVEDSQKDKSAVYNLSYPVGTWVASVKVKNEEIWQKVKAGEIKGFSIEGRFSDKQDLSEVDLIERIKELLK